MATRAERTAERRSFWLHHFEQRESSGLSVSAYAARQSLSVQTWYAARKRYVDVAVRAGERQASRAPAPPRFARVVAPREVARETVTCRIRLGNGALVEFDASPQTLPSVLAAVGSLQ